MQKLKKDLGAPKKPVGGAYGVVPNAKIEEFARAAAARGDKRFGLGVILAGEAWEALSDAEDRPFEAEFLKALEEYNVVLAVCKGKQVALEVAASPPPLRR